MTKNIEISNHNLCKDCGNCCKAMLFGGQLPDMLKRDIDIRDREWLKNSVIEISESESEGILRPNKYEEECQAYTCKIFDKESKKCADYDNRPPICRRYPGHFRGVDDLVNWEGANPYMDCKLVDEILKEEYHYRRESGLEHDGVFYKNEMLLAEATVIEK